MTSNNSLKNNYKQRLKLTLVHIRNCLKRLLDQLKVLASYKTIRLILEPLIFQYITTRLYVLTSLFSFIYTHQKNKSVIKLMIILGSYEFLIRKRFLNCIKALESLCQLYLIEWLVLIVQISGTKRITKSHFKLVYIDLFQVFFKFIFIFMPFAERSSVVNVILEHIFETKKLICVAFAKLQVI